MTFVQNVLTSTFCFFVAAASGSGLKHKMYAKKNIVSTALSLASITQLPKQASYFHVQLHRSFGLNRACPFGY